MRAIILAAGRGVRLRPLTDRIPKPLLPVGGQPLIFHHLRRLRAAGIGHIAINTCHLGKMIQDTVGDGAAFGLRISYSPETTALETAGGVRQAIARGLLPDDAPFLCVNADVLCDVDFSTLSLPAAADCHLLMADNPPAHAAGDFSLAADGKLLPPKTDTLTYTGIGVYRPQLFMDTAAGEKARLLPILQKAIAARTATGEKHLGRWHDTGTAESLAAAREE